MPSGISEDVAVGKLPSAETEDPRRRGPDVLDHDIEVELLRDTRLGPGRRPVIGDQLEGQPRRLGAGRDPSLV